MWIEVFPECFLLDGAAGVLFSELFSFILELPSERIIDQRHILCHGNGWKEYVPKSLVNHEKLQMVGTPKLSSGWPRKCGVKGDLVRRGLKLS